MPPNSSPQPPSPADTHRTVAVGAGPGGPQRQSFPAGQTTGLLVPEVAASAYTHRGLRSQLSGGGSSFKSGGRGCGRWRGGVTPHWSGQSAGGGGGGPGTAASPLAVGSFGWASWSSPRTSRRPSGSTTCLPYDSEQVPDFRIESKNLSETESQARLLVTYQRQAT